MDKPNVVYPCMEYYSAIRRSKILVHVTTWMDLKKILKEARCKNYIYYIISFILNVQKREIIKTESKSVITCGGGWEWILTANKFNRISG